MCCPFLGNKNLTNGVQATQTKRRLLNVNKERKKNPPVLNRTGRLKPSSAATRRERVGRKRNEQAQQQSYRHGNLISGTQKNLPNFQQRGGGCGSQEPVGPLLAQRQRSPAPRPLTVYTLRYFATSVNVNSFSNPPGRRCFICILSRFCQSFLGSTWKPRSSI